jgi:hypothetical protein
VPESERHDRHHDGCYHPNRPTEEVALNQGVQDTEDHNQNSHLSKALADVGIEELPLLGGFHESDIDARTGEVAGNLPA